MSQTLSGWIVLDKPEGMSSNSAMCKVRSFFGEKTGYVGTLDPFAQGILPVAVGEARKFIPYVNDSKKEYEFTIKFGEETDTLDRTGKIISCDGSIPTLLNVTEAIKPFIGKIEQVPPTFSAVRINGVRAYRLARKGVEKIEIRPREVEIFKLEITEENLKNTEVKFRCVCSKGTYIRSLARDISYKLGTYGHVVYLRRNRVNFISSEKAVTIDSISHLSYNRPEECLLLPCESTLDDIPALTLSDNDVLRLQNGLHVEIPFDFAKSEQLYKLFRLSDNRFAGLCKFGDFSKLVPVRMMVF